MQIKLSKDLDRSIIFHAVIKPMLIYKVQFIIQNFYIISIETIQMRYPKWVSIQNVLCEDGVKDHKTMDSRIFLQCNGIHEVLYIYLYKDKKIDNFKRSTVFLNISYFISLFPIRNLQ